METVEAAIVFLPRFTTLVGRVNPATFFDFTTLPLDVSRYGGVQFQIWRSPMSGGTFQLFLEESLDGQTWVLGPAVPSAISMSSDDTKFCSYNFRLRWFRLRVRLTGAASPIVTCWAEGLLRSGGSGVWPVPGASMGASGRPSPAGLTEDGSGRSRPVRPPSGPMPGDDGAIRLDEIRGPLWKKPDEVNYRDLQNPGSKSGFR